MTDLYVPYRAGELVMPFEEGTILPAVKLDLDLKGSLFLSLLGDPMTYLSSSSRSVYVDSTHTVVVKVEHGYHGHPYAVQCWNEYVFWGEYIQGTLESELLAPTLELDVRRCPLETHGDAEHECLVTLSLQEYINDGFADSVWPGAREDGYSPNPWDDCLRPLLRRYPQLKNDLHKDRPEQTRYCMNRGRYVVVDYGLPGTFGWALPSAHYEHEEWQEERLG